jgi:FkbM family methyltransferase
MPSTMSLRSLSYFLPSYASVVREFRNGAALAWAHCVRGEAERAVFWNGAEVCNVPGRSGFVDTIVEIWGLQEYMCDGFYAPADGDVVLDIGAHVGLFSIWIARRAPGARVFAFEPFAENCETLRANVEGWTNNVQVRQLAVGGQSGRARMVDVGERSLDHRLATPDFADGSGHTVEVVTLAQAIEMTGASSIDLLKVDIEGSELAVFEAADRALLARIKRIALEYHDNIRPGTLAQLTDILSRTHRIVSVRGDSYGILQATLNT